MVLLLRANSNKDWLIDSRRLSTDHVRRYSLTAFQTRQVRFMSPSVGSSPPQGRRSVVKYGVGSESLEQAIKVFQVPRKIRHLQFLTRDDVKLTELSNNSFKWKNVTFFFFGGGRGHNILWPLLHILEWSRPEPPRPYPSDTYSFPSPFICDW